MHSYRPTSKMRRTWPSSRSGSLGIYYSGDPLRYICIVWYYRRQWIQAINCTFSKRNLRYNDSKPVILQDVQEEYIRWGLWVQPLWPMCHQQDHQGQSNYCMFPCWWLEVKSQDLQGIGKDNNTTQSIIWKHILIQISKNDLPPRKDSQLPRNDTWIHWRRNCQGQHDILNWWNNSCIK